MALPVRLRTVQIQTLSTLKNKMAILMAMETEKTKLHHRLLRRPHESVSAWQKLYLKVVFPNSRQ